MKLSTLTALGVLLCSLSAAQAAVNSKQRVAAFAKLPDWTGLWEADNKNASAGTAQAPPGYADVAMLKMASKPPYNAEWEAKVQAAIKKGDAPPNYKLCSFGYPAMMDGPGMFQVLAQPEETIFLFHGDDVRHVYTDGRKHPGEDDLWPTPVGDSIGHWEGDTLVINTIARKAGPLHLNKYYVISDKARFIERIRMINKDTLEDQMIIEDPEAFAKPMFMTMYYKRVKDLDRVIYTDCSENERNPVIDGELKIAPPR
ncbi:MAG: hypothetical protein QM808_00450 [Steroidobacteraceae bacterium]